MTKILIEKFFDFLLSRPPLLRECQTLFYEINDILTDIRNPGIREKEYEDLKLFYNKHPHQLSKLALESPSLGVIWMRLQLLIEPLKKMTELSRKFKVQYGTDEPFIILGKNIQQFNSAMTAMLYEGRPACDRHSRLLHYNQEGDIMEKQIEDSIKELRRTCRLKNRVWACLKGQGTLINLSKEDN